MHTTPIINRSDKDDLFTSIEAMGPALDATPLTKRIHRVVESGRVRLIEAKTILSHLRKAPGGDDVFGIGANINLYRGCEHGCIYCDSRSLCYQLGELSDIRVKRNAIELLRKELSGRKTKIPLGTGSMNDPYMPVEAEIGLTREALKILRHYEWPVHIVTKNPLVVRDLDILRDLSRIWCPVSVTITTPDDELSAAIEPHAPPSSFRFAALRRLSENGIQCGVFLMPILPWITDGRDDLSRLLEMAAASGAGYVIAWGLSQREGQREYFHRELERLFPGMRERYERRFGNRYECHAGSAGALHRFIGNQCRELGLRTDLEFYRPTDPQLGCFDG